jgi:glycosyltransferase involved in cell wall biosynthesis
MAKVNILMPVFNSVQRNGNMIHTALNSLLNQTFTDFKLSILDNISDDETPDICRFYAEKDERIDFKVDTERVFPEGGINKLASKCTDPYLMIANCDDKWDLSYIEKLHNVLQAKPEMDCAYSNGSHLGVTNNTGGVLITDDQINDYTLSTKQNFHSFIQFRNVIPLLFGLFKTKAYQSALPYVVFDDIAANVDNLFASKYFLFGNSAYFLNENLFYYRNRPRKLEAETISGMPTEPLLIFIFYVRHQLKLFLELQQYTDDILLKLIALDSSLQQMCFLLSWIVKDLVKTELDKNLSNNIGMILPPLRTGSIDFTPIQLHNDLLERCGKIKKILNEVEIYYGGDPIIKSTRDTLDESIKMISGG